MFIYGYLILYKHVMFVATFNGSTPSIVFRKIWNCTEVQKWFPRFALNSILSALPKITNSLSHSLRFLSLPLNFSSDCDPRAAFRFTGADSAATRRGSIDEFRGVAGVEFAVPARTCGMSLVLTPANPRVHARTRGLACRATSILQLIYTPAEGKLQFYRAETCPPLRLPPARFNLRVPRPALINREFDHRRPLSLAILYRAVSNATARERKPFVSRLLRFLILQSVPTIL